jgi:peptidylamidoglycolate lyase
LGRHANRQPRRTFLHETGRELIGLTLASALSPFSFDMMRKHKSDTSPAEISPVTRYELDPAWPQKPESLGTWAGNPAVMIGAKQQIWVSNRAFPAMMIFDAKGNFIKAWDSPRLFSEKGPTLFQNRERGPYNLHFFRFDAVGNVWIANTNRHVIQKCDQDGNVLLTIGTIDVPGADNTHLNLPTDMTITPAGVFVSDGYGNRRVVHFSLEGKFIKTWGKHGTGPEGFIDPHSICHIREHLYVVDRGNIRIKVYDFNGKLLDIWRDLMIAWPLVPTTDNTIWTCGCTPIRLDRYTEITGGQLQQDQIAVKFNPEGKILQIWSFPTCPRSDRHVPGKLNMLHGICADAEGNLYLGEAFNPGPQKFSCSNQLNISVKGEFPAA